MSLSTELKYSHSTNATKPTLFAYLSFAALWSWSVVKGQYDINNMFDIFIFKYFLCFFVAYLFLVETYINKNGS